MIHVQAGGGETFDLAGAEHRVALGGKDTNGAVAVVDVVVAPGAGTPPHSDEREDLVFHVVEGPLRFDTEDGPLTVEAGGTVYCPRGTRHGFSNAGHRPGRLLMVATPAGIEDFLRDAALMLPAGVPTAPPPAEALSAFAELAARHGITVHPPASD